ncbi:MAG: stage III sporulation protein AC [Oscillospiraceae bacterium]|nr:stage III sporulation protein AC [Oscillospiraceae bacterium]
MDIELILRIAAIGVIVSILNVLLKKSDREEQAMMITLAGLIIVLIMIIQEIGNLFEAIRDIFGVY